MNGMEYVKCSNGHYYQSNYSKCPFCGGDTVINGSNKPSNTTQKTEMYDIKTEVDGNTVISMPTNSGSSSHGSYSGTVKTPEFSNRTPNQGYNGGTVFGDLEDSNASQSNEQNQYQRQSVRTKAKLVGWLVSYTLDPIGVDYKLFEGRNSIGRAPECNITVNDNMVSGKHAIILFRANKYVIQDQLSTHGTFVNDGDIFQDPFELKDGDVIRIGKTILKFRTSF